MAEVPRYVVDSSVALRWYLKDEPHREHAMKVLDDWDQDRIVLLAPSIIYAEIASGLRNATRAMQRPRMSNTDGLDALAAFLDFDLQTTPFERLIPDAYILSGRLGCSVYDALFLSLADLAQCPIVYADDRLRRGLGNRFPLALWIEDYQSSKS